MAKNKEILVDTDILIKVYRGNKEKKLQVDAIRGEIAISVITALELFQGANSAKRVYELSKQLKAYHILHIDHTISIKALHLTRQSLPGNLLLPPDALIAATSLIYGLDIFTDNKADFINIAGIRFYEP
ncbi:MAG: PIN domain-containing protein [Bacteroidetes bacterium]|nr:PIN domain-containing protein [Bacteroidota bacterium]